VLRGTAQLEDALVDVEPFGGQLQCLLAGDGRRPADWVADQFFLPTSTELVDEAERLADFVIVDSPPLTDVIDTLPLAQRVDELLVVVRQGKTHLTKLARLMELLARHDVKPVGFTVVGVSPPEKDHYYYALAPAADAAEPEPTPEMQYPDDRVVRERSRL
jgi:Mrp family chromosome partitioning ATPase